MPDIRVEVVYALPERQYLRQLVLQEGVLWNRRFVPPVCWRYGRTSISTLIKLVSSAGPLNWETNSVTGTGWKSTGRCSLTPRSCAASARTARGNSPAAVISCLRHGR
ncbi:hypothetical protein SODG_004138 [Sodalis praecaptivus]